MNIQAEISLYPLRVRNLGPAIERVLDTLKAAGVSVRPGTMSSIVAGDADVVFPAVAAAFQAAAEDHQIVLVMKVSNACPSADTLEGNSTHVG